MIASKEMISIVFFVSFLILTPVANGDTEAPPVEVTKTEEPTVTINIDVDDPQNTDSSTTIEPPAQTETYATTETVTDPPTTTETLTEAPVTTEAETESPTTTEATTDPPTTTLAPTDPSTTTVAPTDPPTTTIAPTDPPTTTIAPTDPSTDPPTTSETSTDSPTATENSITIDVDSTNQNSTSEIATNSSSTDESLLPVEIENSEPVYEALINATDTELKNYIELARKTNYLVIGGFIVWFLSITNLVIASINFYLIFGRYHSHLARIAGKIQIAVAHTASRDLHPQIKMSMMCNLSKPEELKNIFAIIKEPSDFDHNNDLLPKQKELRLRMSDKNKTVDLMSSKKSKKESKTEKSQPKSSEKKQKETKKAV